MVRTALLATLAFTGCEAAEFADRFNVKFAAAMDACGTEEKSVDAVALHDAVVPHDLTGCDYDPDAGVACLDGLPWGCYDVVPEVPGDVIPELPGACWDAIVCS